MANLLQSAHQMIPFLKNVLPILIVRLLWQKTRKILIFEKLENMIQNEKFWEKIRFHRLIRHLYQKRQKAENMPVVPDV